MSEQQEGAPLSEVSGVLPTPGLGKQNDRQVTYRLADSLVDAFAQDLLEALSKGYVLLGSRDGASIPIQILVNVCFDGQEPHFIRAFGTVSLERISKFKKRKIVLVSDIERTMHEPVEIGCVILDALGTAHVRPELATKSSCRFVGNLAKNALGHDVLGRISNILDMQYEIRGGPSIMETETVKRNQDANLLACQYSVVPDPTMPLVILDDYSPIDRSSKQRMLLEATMALMSVEGKASA